MSKLEDYLTESILDPLQEKLSPELWDENKTLKKSVKIHIVKKLETWLRSQTSKKIKKMFILGSMCGYQYTRDSDIDVNFVMDVTDEERKEIAESMMAELNEKNLSGTKHPVNYFISQKFRPNWKTDGPLYDLLKDKWVSEPKENEQKSVIGNFRAVTEIARFFIAGLDLMISEFYADVAAYENYTENLHTAKTKEDKKDLENLINFKLQEIVADIDGVYVAKHMVWALRKEAFEKGEGLDINTKIDIKDSNNFSINNLIYKYVEKLGYFKKIKEVMDESDKWNKELQTG